jgi:hypothetical protein
MNFLNLCIKIEKENPLVSDLDAVGGLSTNMNTLLKA